MKTSSPASALRAFRAMLQGCEHAEVLAEPDVPGAAVIKHHDAYIRATVERETLEDHFLFRFYVTFKLEQETPELEKALNDELGDRLLPLFPDTLRTWGGMTGENPLTLSVGLFAPPALEELEALKAIFDDLVARYPVHYVGNYAKRVEADQAARKEKAEQKDDQPGWILSMYNAIKNHGHPGILRRMVHEPPQRRLRPLAQPLQPENHVRQLRARQSHRILD